MPRHLSDVWEHYLVLSEADGKKHVTCSYCSSEYKYAMANKLKRHLLKCDKCPNDVKNVYKHNTVPTTVYYSQEATGSPPTSSNMAWSSSTIAHTSSTMSPLAVTIDVRLV